MPLLWGPFAAFAWPVLGDMLFASGPCIAWALGFWPVCRCDKFRAARNGQYWRLIQFYWQLAPFYCYFFLIGRNPVLIRGTENSESVFPAAAAQPVPMIKVHRLS